jgi:hypothetical protein
MRAHAKMGRSMLRPYKAIGEAAKLAAEMVVHSQEWLYYCANYGRPRPAVAALAGGCCVAAGEARAAS